MMKRHGNANTLYKVKLPLCISYTRKTKIRGERNLKGNPRKGLYPIYIGPDDDVWMFSHFLVEYIYIYLLVSLPGFQLYSVNANRL